VKKYRAHKLAVIVLTACIGPAIAQTTQQECQDVINAANNGKTAANVLINNAEQDLRNRLEATRTCLEAFGAASARTTIMLGGFDLGPIQNMLASAACSIIEKGASSITAAVPSLPPIVYTPVAPAPLPEPELSVWEKLAKLFLLEGGG
jgi:hypothetical protein